METIAEIPLAALLAGVVLQLALGRFLKPRAKGWLAFLCGLVALGGLLSLVPTIAAGRAVDASLFAWEEGIRVQFHVDGLSLLFALMAIGIGSAILIYCIDYMAHEAHGTTRFYALMLTFIAGLVSLVFSANLLMAYLSWEVIGLCSYFLVGFWYQQPAAANGARKVLIMTHIPGYALLLGILLLYNASGTFIWTDPAVAAHFTTGIFLLMLVAAMAKSVMFPLHTWIPEAMNAPTPVSALLHSACYVKAGIYLIARIYAIHGAGPWPVAWNTLVLAVGCATMLVGGLFALTQTDLKRLLAFSTISQLGYIVTGIGIGTPAGLFAGLFYCFSHGLFKGTLFLCAGAIQHSTGTRDMRKLGGLAARMPVTFGVWLVAACAIVGVPLTNGFVAKWLLFDAALGANQWIAVVVAWLVSVLTAFYILKATVNVFFGDLPEEAANVGAHEAPLAMRVGMGVLALFSLLFGIAPQVLGRWIVSPAVSALGFEPDQALSWFGIHAALSGGSAAAAGSIVVIALLAAGLIFVLRKPQAETAATVAVFNGGDPLAEGSLPGVEDFADIAQTAFAPVYETTDPDPLYLWIWRRVRGLAGQLAQALAPAERHPILISALFALAIVAVAWLF